MTVRQETSYSYDPSRVFEADCLADCAFAQRCISIVGERERRLDAIDDRVAQLSTMPPHVRATDEFKDQHSTATTASIRAEYALLDAERYTNDVAMSCYDGPGRNGECGSDVYHAAKMRQEAERRGGGRALRKVLALGLTATLAVGGYLYTHKKVSAESPSSRPKTEQTTDTSGPICLGDLVTGLEADACTTLAPFPRPNATDIVKLPASASSAANSEICGSDDTDKTPPVLAGYINPTTGESKLIGAPEAYQKALAEIVNNPAEKYLLSKTGTVLVWYTDDWENGYNVDQVGAGAQDRMDLCIGDNELETKYDMRLYKTIGEMQMTIFHEGAHALHASWFDKAEQPGGERTQELLDQLSISWSMDRKFAAEQIRQAHGPEIIAVLDEVRGQLVAKNRMQLASAFQHLIDYYRHPDGLAAIGYSDARGRVRTLKEQLGVTVAQLGEEYTDAMLKDDQKDIDLSALSEETAKLIGYYEKAFAHYDEGAVMPDLKFNNAHAYDNEYELVASLLSATQTDPDEVVKRILSLPQERRYQAIMQAEIVLELIPTNDPDLLPHIYLGQVVEKLRAETGSTKPVLASARQETRWLSMPLTALYEMTNGKRELVLQ